MDASQSYIVISILVLAIIALFIFFIRKDKREKKFTPLAGVALGLILAGMFFSDSRLASYSLVGAGVVLAVVDMILKFKQSKGSRLT